MNFFKSVFSDDPDPQTQEFSPDCSSNEDDEEKDHHPDQDSSRNALKSNPNPNPNSSIGGGWGYAGLIQTLKAKSETVIETYRRDLKEFGSGLKKETVTFREVASRAVKELPTSIEAGASKAQGSLETVWKGTAQIISHTKEAILTVDRENNSLDSQSSGNLSFDSKQYNRFDTRIRKIQSELGTYCDEPEDLDDYNKWKLGLELEEKGEKLEMLFEENGDMEEIYRRVVPNEIDRETFWCRYFYKVHKLQQAEDFRAKLVKRAILRDDDEDLSWDYDDDDNGNNGDEGNVLSKAEVLENRELGEEVSRAMTEVDSVEESRVGNSGVDEKRKNDDEESNVLSKVDSKEDKKLSEKDCSKVRKFDNVDEKEKDRSILDIGSKSTIEDSSSDYVKDKMQVEANPNMKKDELVEKSAEKLALEGRNDRDGSFKGSEFSVVLNQTSVPEEEEFGWDEIEDLGSGDEKKEICVESPNRADLKKRLSAADEEEDLSWDIEDDDEPIKA